MKKVTGILLKLFAALIALVVVAAILIPIIFKGKIREEVEKAISENLMAEVRFQDYHVGLFRHFPHLSFSLDELSVVGVDNFKGDTLAAMNSFALVFDLSSLFSDKGYEIRSIDIKNPVINAIILKDGSVNWDIMKTDTTETVSSSESEESSFLLKLREVRATGAKIAYIDYEGDMSAYLENTNITLSGDMTMSETDLLIKFDVGSLTFIMEDLKYLNSVEGDGSLKLLANLDTWIFTISDNNIRLNDLNFSLAGTVEMPEDDITTDLTFETGEASFKSLLSLVPSVYMEGYEALDAAGFLKMKGSVVGVYSDETMPNVTAQFNVDKGKIKYPDLPGSIDNVIAEGSFFYDGTNMDGTTLDLKRFHFEMAGNSFDMSLALKTPVSDPDFIFSANGKVDFGALSKAIPMEGMTLSGMLDAAVSFEGKYSQIEKEQYEVLKAMGKMELTAFSVVMEDMPSLKISKAILNFSPRYSSLEKMDMMVGQNSDISFSGAMENYIGFFLKDDILKGSFAMNSKMIDVGEIMAAMPSDSLAVENDTVALTLVRIPSNINFKFGASIDKLLWDEIKADQIKGTMLVNEGVLTISDAGMSMLGGRIGMDATYDTRDSLKPMVKALLKASDIDIKSSFETFNTVKKLAPAAKGLEGDVSVEFSYESLLGDDFMPVIKTINGKGKLNSSSVQVVESQVFDKMKSTLKLSDKYTDTFEDIEVSFTIKDGRIYVKPFNTKLGKIKFNIGGDQGLDKSINYLGEDGDSTIGIW